VAVGSLVQNEQCVVIPCPNNYWAHMIRCENGMLYAAIKGLVVAWKISNAYRVATVFEGHEGKIRAMEFHMHSLYTSSADWSIRRWNVTVCVVPPFVWYKFARASRTMMPERVLTLALCRLVLARLAIVHRSSSVTPIRSMLLCSTGSSCTRQAMMARYANGN
jgi:WD40 repeat protein